MNQYIVNGAFAMGLAAMTLTAPAGAQAPPAPSSAPSPREIRAEKARVQLVNDVRVPSQIEGMLTEILAEEGSLVEKGAVLAVVDDTQAKLTLELKQAEEREAELNAANDVNLRNAVNTEELARAEAESYAEMRQQGAIPHWEYEKKRLEAETATLRIELAELQESVTKTQYIAKRSERRMAEFEVQRRRIVAPFSGLVEKREAQLGEWVQPGSPIVQLIQMDRLRVGGTVRADSVITSGMPATVEIQLGNQRFERFNGTLGYVSSDLDMSDRRRVWVEFENVREGNDWKFKPGMQAQIIIHTAPALAGR
jgi:multidrug efflux pump subunit AcrA (membrane-fusion protein)